MDIDINIDMDIDTGIGIGKDIGNCILTDICIDTDRVM